MSLFNTSISINILSFRRSSFSTFSLCFCSSEIFLSLFAVLSMRWLLPLLTIKLSNIHLDILETACEFSKIDTILEETLMDKAFFWIIFVCLCVMQSLIYLISLRDLGSCLQVLIIKHLQIFAIQYLLGYHFFQSFGRYHSPFYSLTRKLIRFSVRSPFMWATLITLTSELSSTYYLHFIRRLNKSRPTCFLPLITSAINFIDHSLYGIINRGFLLSSIACRFLIWILFSSPDWASWLSNNFTFYDNFKVFSNKLLIIYIFL